MSKPRVVIDSAIRVTPRLRALPIELVPQVSTDISRDTLVDAQALLTRTVTRVDGRLLDGADVRFVGTASAGTDHIDLNYLAARGIPFSSAAGCNASAVGDYVLAAIALCGKLEPILAGAEVGLVGYGNVGRGLAKRLAALGARVRVYDPWTTQFDSHVQETDLQGVLSCGVVSLHAALHDSQPFPSFGMIGLQEAKVIGRDTLFINAGRGGLLSEEAALYLVERGVDLVLDTWPNEPRVSLELLNGARYATPHIAGYSETAKTMPQISSSRPLLKRWSSKTTELSLRVRVVIPFCLLGVQITACWPLYLVQLGELRPTTPSFARHGHETKVPIRLSDSGANTPCANNLRGFWLAEKPHHCA